MIFANEAKKNADFQSHSVSISSGYGAVGETISFEYEFQFRSDWHLNTIAIHAKYLEFNKDEFDAFGLSIKRSMQLSKSWNIYASAGLNKYKTLYFNGIGANTSSLDNYSSEKGVGAIGSLGADFHIKEQFFLGFRVLLIDVGNYQGRNSVDFRLSYRF
ncbi:MAG: hypothetical protein COB38_00120 [Gammaproteobacteria bacterium]|nr:MAG: hypothetical protein COB38_00120 [Gammaproteobacteria bacterium]